MRRFFLLLLLVLSALPVLAATAVVDWTQSFVNVRSEPGYGTKKVGAIQTGGKVEILAQKGEWAKVRYAGGEGWVVLKSLRMISEKPQPKPVTAAKPAEAESGASEVRQETPASAPTPQAVPIAPVAPPAPEPATVAKPAAQPIRPPSGYLSDVPEKQALPEVSIGKTLVSMVSGLLLVLAIIGGVVWAMRRFFSGKFPQLQGTGAIRVLATRPVAQRQALMLVEVGGEVYLLGQTESDLSLISKIDSPDAVDRLDYLFTFKATKFESELRRELDVETKEEQAGENRAPQGVAESIAARLARLRGRPGSPEKP